MTKPIQGKSLYMISGPDYTAIDQRTQPAPTPCPDCGRAYLMGESVVVLPPGRTEPAWSGCIDCWLRRTSPAMRSTFIDPDDEQQIEALEKVMAEHYYHGHRHLAVAALRFLSEGADRD